MRFEVADELSVEIKDEPGAVSHVLDVVAASGSPIRAFCGYAMGGAGNMMFVPKNAAKAKAALRKAGYKAITTSKVVLAVAPDKAGMGAKILDKARDHGVNLEYAYATGTGRGTGAIVLAPGSAPLARKLAKVLAAK